MGLARLLSGPPLVIVTSSTHRRPVLKSLKTISAYSFSEDKRKNVTKPTSHSTASGTGVSTDNKRSRL